MLNILIVVMLLAEFAVPLAASPPVCLVSFLGASVVTFFAGKSRRVIDPIAGVHRHTVLSPSDFHSWANLVCSSNSYRASYDRYVFDADRGYDQKFPLVFSQVKAINYIHAGKVLMLLLGGVLAFDIYDTFFAGEGIIWQSPVAAGLGMGGIWGYSFGLYRLWRTCRVGKPGEP